MEKRITKPLWMPESEILQCATKYETPFHLYDENTIRKTCETFKTAFSWAPGFTNYFAVKATPNPYILKILKDEGFGADCSSLPELVLAESVGFSGSQIFFTSNNTPLSEFRKAKELGAVINLDDISHIDFIHETIGLPNYLCFRYNPGPTRTGNIIIGHPENSKFGMTRDQIFEAIEKSLTLGVERFSLHTMVISNSLDENEILENAKMLFYLGVEIFNRTGIKIDMVNLGGGIGIPYKPEDTEFDINHLSQKMQVCYEDLCLQNGLQLPKIAFECGRYITGSAGVLVTRIIHQKNTYKKFIGVDACMTNLMRPAIYNAYHHITHIKDPAPNTQKQLPQRRYLFNKESSGPNGVYDIVGSLCENNDKFAEDRFLGTNVEIGDLLVIHDTGAHGHSMGFNYNGKLRSAEYLRDNHGQIAQIRRKETVSNYFSTLHWTAMKLE